MKEIKLTQGKVALVDDEDFEELNKYKWNARLCGSSYYACRDIAINKKMVKLYMHRVIMNTPKGMLTDHVDMCTLNNQKSNLRICNKSENNMNRKLQTNNLSGYRGVSWSKIRLKWISRIKIDRKEIPLGYFDDPKDAAIAYDSAATIHFGQFARLNFKHT